MPDTRYEIQDEASVLRITIPGRRPWLLLPILMVWSLGWIFGWFLVTGALLWLFYRVLVMGITAGLAQPPGPGGVLPLLALVGWWIAWSIGGPLVLYRFFEVFTAVEIIEVSPDRLRLIKKVWKWSSASDYDTGQVHALSLANEGMNSSMSFLQGSIFFDYGAKRIRFGRGLDRFQCRPIVSAILGKYPQLAKESPPLEIARSGPVSLSGPSGKASK